MRRAPSATCATRVFLAALSLTAALSAGATARADELTPAEDQRLDEGATITRARTLMRDNERYVGGVTYTILSAHERDLAALFNNVDAWQHILPRTRSAREVGSAGGDPLIELTHGSSLVQVAYTVRLHRSGNTVRFWLVPSRHHDIADLWGFFRTEPVPGDKTLLTYGILVDMGPGLLRDLFEDRVREAALSVPERVRDLLADRRLGARAKSLVAGAGLP